MESPYGKGLTLLAGRLLEAERQAAWRWQGPAGSPEAVRDQQQNASNQYRQIHHQQWTDRGSAGDHTPQNSQYHAFINRAGKCSDPAVPEVVAGARGAQPVPFQWLEAQQRRRVAGCCSARQGPQLKAQRQEQKMLDDYAIPATLSPFWPVTSL